MSFVLLGDSGQHDPEIYREVVQENLGRILAIYIRDVRSGNDGTRAEEIAELADQTRKWGVEMLLSPQTADFAAHAALEGLIRPLDLPNEVDEQE